MPRALGSYRLSFGASPLAATINLVFGFIIAWTLVRYEFPGKSIIDALIDMPSALPTAVSGIALTTVFAQNGWVGQYLEPLGIKVAYTWIGVTVALTLIGMPFMVRTVQPAIAEVQKDLEDAAETLGAGRFHIFSSHHPADCDAGDAHGLRAGAPRAASGEYGSVIFISGNLPMKTEITPLLIVIKLEEFDYKGAAALGTVMLAISFVMLLAINLLQARGRRRVTPERSLMAARAKDVAKDVFVDEHATRPGRDTFMTVASRALFIGLSLLFLAALLIAPLATVFAMALEKGWQLYLL